MEIGNVEIFGPQGVINSMDNPVLQSKISLDLDPGRSRASTDLNVQKRLQIVQSATRELRSLVQRMEYTRSSNAAMCDRQQTSVRGVYLPGEMEALESDTPRTFTFKVERTITNEAQHVHFRVAESIFFRLLSATSRAMNVDEVQYIVTPHLVRQFQMRRSELAYAMNKKVEDVVPELMTLADHGHRTRAKTTEELTWIAQNGFRDMASQGVDLSNDCTCTSDYLLSEPHHALICLVLCSDEINTALRGISSQKTSERIGTKWRIFDPACVLPYYIVKYSANNNNNNQYQYQHHVATTVANEEKKCVRKRLLDEEFQVMEEEAKADKFMHEARQFYQESLQKRAKELSFGEVDGTDLFFDVIYKKRLETEQEFVINGPEDLMSPTSGEFELEFDVNEEDDDDYSMHDEEDEEGDEDDEDGTVYDIDDDDESDIVYDIDDDDIDEL